MRAWALLRRPGSPSLSCVPWPVLTLGRNRDFSARDSADAPLAGTGHPVLPHLLDGLQLLRFRPPGSGPDLPLSPFMRSKSAASGMFSYLAPCLWRRFQCLPRNCTTNASTLMISRLSCDASPPATSGSVHGNVPIRIKCTYFTTCVATGHEALGPCWQSAPLPDGFRTRWLAVKCPSYSASAFQSLRWRKELPGWHIWRVSNRNGFDSSLQINPSLCTEGPPHADPQGPARVGPKECGVGPFQVRVD